jgi:transposase
MPRLSYKYQLYPTRSQYTALTAMLGTFCNLYDAALQQRSEAWRRGKSLQHLDQANEPKG